MAGSTPATSVVSTLKEICSSSVEGSTSSDVEERTSLVSHALAQDCVVNLIENYDRSV